MIISFSGRIGSGKDTAGKIAAIILNSPQLNDGGVANFLKKDIGYQDGWQIKKFADKLKDIVCILLGCTREQLEDREFKEKELGPEWDKWYVEKYGLIKAFNPHDWEIQNKHKPFGTELECKLWWEKLRNSGSHALGNPYIGEVRFVKHSMTPRLLLQLLGTECGRQIIHPNIWVNALMSEYKPSDIFFTKIRRKGFSSIPKPGELEKAYPNWVITDTRFPNETDAIIQRNGHCFQMQRDTEQELKDKGIHIPEHLQPLLHESETALDNFKFASVIQNNGAEIALIPKVRLLLNEYEIK